MDLIYHKFRNPAETRKRNVVMEKPNLRELNAQLFATDPGTIEAVPPGDYDFGDESGDDHSADGRPQREWIRPRSSDSPTKSQVTNDPNQKKAQVVKTGTSGTSDTECVNESEDVSPPGSPGDDDRVVVIIEDVPNTSVPSPPPKQNDENTEHSLSLSKSDSYVQEEEEEEGETVHAAQSTNDENEPLSFDKLSQTCSGVSSHASLKSEPWYIGEISEHASEEKVEEESTLCGGEIVEDEPGSASQEGRILAAGADATSDHANEINEDPQVVDPAPQEAVEGKESGDVPAPHPVPVVSEPEAAAQKKAKTASGSIAENDASEHNKAMPRSQTLAEDVLHDPNDEYSELPEPPSPERVPSDDSLALFLAELEGDEKQPPSSAREKTTTNESRNNTLASPTPHSDEVTPAVVTPSPDSKASSDSPRRISKLAPSSHDTKPRNRMASRVEPTVQEALATTPLSARRAQLLAMQSSPSQRSVGGKGDMDPAFSTPIRERTEAFLSEIQSHGSYKGLVAADAVTTPLSARREALLSAASDKNEPLAFDGDGLRVGPSTAVHKRQLSDQDVALFASSEAATTSDARLQGTTHGHMRQMSDQDIALFASSTPVNARREALQAKRKGHRRRLSDQDVALLASSAPIDERRAAFAESLSPRKLSFERDTYLAASTSLDARRAAWSESSSQMSSFERDISITSTMSLEERRAAFAIMSGIRKSSAHSRENDEAFLAASNMGVKARQALYAKFLHESTLRHSRSLQAELEELKKQSLVSSRRRTLRNRRARSDRLFYQIGQKRGGLSDQDYLRVADFLPRDRVILELKASSELYDGPNLAFEPARRKIAVPLCIWLTNPEEKTFEIVCFEMKGEMTVEEAIEEACNHALDPVLSEQHYVSLCNNLEELVEPTKSVEQLLEKESSSHHQTLMAVPFGSTAAMVRAIRRVLEKTDQMKRWLNRPDPFTAEEDEEEEEEEKIEIEPPVPSRRRRHRHRRVLV